MPTTLAEIVQAARNLHDEIRDALGGYLITGYDGQAVLAPGAFLLTHHPF